jgi:hypothetical protein
MTGVNDLPEDTQMPLQAGGDGPSDELGVLRMIAHGLAAMDPWIIDAAGQRYCQYCKRSEHYRWCIWKMAQHWGSGVQ